MRAKILNASAGSGKTYQLAYKYVCDVIEVPDRYRHILAVTFTNKATEEMKSRILERIHELASADPSPYLHSLCSELSLTEQEVRQRARIVRSKILHDYSHFTVLTIDKFFQRILRAFIRELGIAPDYNTEIETESIVGRSADMLIEQITTDQELRRWLMEFVEERIDQGRRWDIREGILSLSSELFKEQNRASLSISRSKEELRKLVNRASAQALHTQHQMQELAREAIGLIAAKELSVADFPYKTTGFATYFYKTTQTIEAYGNRVREACTNDAAWGKAGTPSQSMRGVLQPLLCRMCEIYDHNLRSWNTSELLRENFRSFALLSDLYTRIQQMCDQENMMLLSETKYILSEFIGHNDAPFIYEKAGNRFDRFMIDEFQDTSAREWENFLPLLQNAMSQSDSTSVLLVGDIKQSIYRWRGGDWRILHNRAATALGVGTKMINLQENFRSLPLIVEFNNHMIGAITTADNTQLNSELTEAMTEGRLDKPIGATLIDTLLGAYRGHEQVAARNSDCCGCVRIATFAEQPPVIDCIKQTLDLGFLPQDILILVRTNNEGVQIAEMLLEFKQRNDDPRYRFDVMTQEALIVGNAPICGFVTAVLRLAVNPDETMSRSIYNGYLGYAFDTPVLADEKDFFTTLRQLAPEEAFEQIVMRYALHERQSEIAYLQAIHEAIIRFCTRKIADIPLFLRWWDETGSNESLSVERSRTTISIMTIHKAKGLENKVVILPFCSWALAPEAGRQPVVWGEADEETAAQIGRFPVRYKKNMAESHFSAEYYRELVYTHVDNINLLYVALTRAAEQLHIFIPQQNRNKTHVGTLITNCITTNNKECRLSDMHGQYTQSEVGEIYEFGETSGPAAHKAEEQHATHILLDSYPTAEPALRLRLPQQRYFEQEAQAELAPRNLGILMHKAFENARSEADIRQAVESMRTNSLISAEQAVQLTLALDRALAHPAVHEWFGTEWENVRNEHEIIVPQEHHVRRPDRVMIHGLRAVVVDYKFGDHEPEKYHEQIREYADLLRKIGYTQTEGYLWYVKLGTIERVV